MSARGDPSHRIAASVPSPFGPIGLVEEDGAIVRLTWPLVGPEPRTPLLRAAADQLAAYFAGDRDRFDLPLRAIGGAFEMQVWEAMRAIPFGDTRTYGEIAAELGSAAQPVGNACGANPIPILIPCHRVLGATGLGGFSASGGVEDKVWLLRHERAGGLLI